MQRRSISGVAVFDTSGTTCPAPPADFADFVSYLPLVMSGSLDGCWYTKVEAFKEPTGHRAACTLESGQELFVGSLNGGPVGLFTTTYKFKIQWDRTSRVRKSVDVASTQSYGRRERRNIDAFGGPLDLQPR